jgi:hypothetical protein
MRIVRGTERMVATGNRSPFPKQRKYRRYNLECPVLVQFADGKSVSELNAVSKNVSLGGMLLSAEVPIPQNCPVLLTMTIEGSAMARPLQVRIEGRVVRVITHEPGFDIAVECNRPISRIENLLSASQSSI